MSYTIKGEVEVQKGFGLPRHTTSTRTAYTPPEKGYKVFDTDLNQEFTWNGTDWLASISSADIPDNTDYVDLLSDQSIKGTKAFTETLDINRSSSAGAAKIKFSEYNTSNAFNMALKTGILTLEHTGVFSGTLELTASHAAISAGTAVNRAEIKAISAGTGEFKFTNHGTEVLSLAGTGNWISTRKFQSAETVAGDDDTVLATKGYVESVANSPTLSIGDLTDVDITTNPPLAGYVISWNDTTSRFEPSIVTAADRVLKAGDTMTGDLKVLKSTPKLTLEGSVPTIAMVMPTTSLNIEQFGNTGRIRHTGEAVTTDVTFGSSGVTASGGPFRYETTVVDQAFNIPNILFTHATYVKKAGDTMTGTLSVNSLIELVTSSTGTAPIRFKYNTTTNGSAIYHRTQDDSLTFVKYDTGSSSTENQMRIVSDYIQGDSEFRSLVATTAGSDDSVLTTKDYVDSLAVDTANFVTLDGDETLTGAKSFANNEFDVTLANGTKAIDVRGNDGFPGTYLNASDGVDDDSEIKVVPFVCSFTSENSTNNIFATMYTNAGGSGTCTVETTKNQTNISTRETANFQVRTTGVEVFVAGPGEFGAGTSQFDIDANGFMYQKNGDTEFEFNDTTNKFVVELNDQTLITYTSSTGGQLDFGVKVTSAQTVDADDADVLTTKQFVLDKIAGAGGGGSQPDYELVVGSGSAAYTLGFTPATAEAGKANMQVFVNGIKQIEGSGKSYTVSGTTLTFTTGNIPSSGDDVEFYGFG